MMATGKMGSAKLREIPAKERINEIDMSIGWMSGKDAKPPKTDGIKIRGTGAATKGVKARGPMA